MSVYLILIGQRLCIPLWWHHSCDASLWLMFESAPACFSYTFLSSLIHLKQVKFDLLFFCLFINKRDVALLWSNEAEQLERAETRGCTLAHLTAGLCGITHRNDKTDPKHHRLTKNWQQTWKWPVTEETGDRSRVSRDNDDAAEDDESELWGSNAQLLTNQSPAGIEPTQQWLGLMVNVGLVSPVVTCERQLTCFS